MFTVRKLGEVLYNYCPLKSCEIDGFVTCYIAKFGCLQDVSCIYRIISDECKGCFPVTRFLHARTRT